MSDAIIIDGWSFTTVCAEWDGWAAPVAIQNKVRLSVKGNLLHDHPRDPVRFPKGKRIVTSRIANYSGKQFTTSSGTVYELGEVDERYHNWIKDRNWDYDPDNTPFELLS